MTVFGERDLLLVVDVQNDFCPGGQLAVEEGDLVVPLINQMAARFMHVALTQDWHPKNHSSFANQHDGKNPYDSVEMCYGPQTLWPDHCVQGSEGAAFHPALDTSRASVVIRKGMRQEVDSYSAFAENDRKTQTGLAGYLSALGIERIYLSGLALDFCVAWSAVDARRHGFAAIVVEDATRPVNLPGTVEAARTSFAEHGIDVVSTESLIG